MAWTEQPAPPLPPLPRVLLAAARLFHGFHWSTTDGWVPSSGMSVAPTFPKLVGVALWNWGKQPLGVTWVPVVGRNTWQALPVAADPTLPFRNSFPLATERPEGTRTSMRKQCHQAAISLHLTELSGTSCGARVYHIVPSGRYSDKICWMNEWIEVNEWLLAAAGSQSHSLASLAERAFSFLEVEYMEPLLGM